MRGFEDFSNEHDNQVENETLTLVGGVDISFVKGNDKLACACLVVLSFPDLTVMYSDCAMVNLTEPYKSGFLAFREVSHLIDRLNVLKSTKPGLLPQIILVDGNGILHHKGFGLASHLGVYTNIPTIGIGKTLLMVDGLNKNIIKTAPRTVLKKGGETFELIGDSGNVLGMGVCATSKVVNPVFVSIGSGISLRTAVGVVLECGRFRVPEPVRQADLISREYLRVNGYS
eukprot:CFRG1747T1